MPGDSLAIDGTKFSHNNELKDSYDAVVRFFTSVSGFGGSEFMCSGYDMGVVSGVEARSKQKIYI